MHPDEQYPHDEWEAERLQKTADMFPGEARTEDPNRRYTTPEFMAWIKAKADVAVWDVDVAADEESHHADRYFSIVPYATSSGIDGLAQSWLPPAEVRSGFHQDMRPCRVCDGRGSVPVEGGGSICGACYDHQGEEVGAWCIFCNPPFDDLDSWVRKTWATITEANASRLAVRVAFVLPGNRHEQPFWQEMIEPFRDDVNRFGYKLRCHFPPGRQAYAKPGSNGEAVGSADFPSCLLIWRRA